MSPTEQPDGSKSLAANGLSNERAPWGSTDANDGFAHGLDLGGLTLKHHLQWRTIKGVGFQPDRGWLISL